jgi:hypothetical protein
MNITAQARIFDEMTTGILLHCTRTDPKSKYARRVATKEYAAKDLVRYRGSEAIAEDRRAGQSMAAGAAAAAAAVFAKFRPEKT